jgi:diguanylate cyclase (GGDEF)-like protein/PAS domain S-box-containing protein
LPLGGERRAADTGHNGSGRERIDVTVLIGAEHDKGLADMLDALPERVVRYRLPDLTITYCNVAWAAWNNLEPAQVIGCPLDQFLSADGLMGLASQLSRLGPDHMILTDDVFRADLNAPDHFVEWVDRYVVGPDGPSVIAVGRDVSRRYIAEMKLAESEALFRDLADKSSDIVWRLVTSPSPHFEYVSPSIERILGYPPSYFTDDFTRILDILDDEGRAAVTRSFYGEPLPARSDFTFRHADGSILIGELVITPLRGGVQGVGRDVTQLRRLQADLAALALRDPLTGLANRRLFDELLAAKMARTERTKEPLAIAFLDLDGFKRVNDTYGHDAGDIVLRETARRLLAMVRGADVVARIGGDEFVIVYEPDDVATDDIVARINVALSAPIDISHSVSVTCPASVGRADTTTVGNDAAVLLASADAAMYAVKRARQGQRSTWI